MRVEGRWRAWWVAAWCAVGCAKQSSGLTVGIQPRAGYECREVRVGVHETDVDTYKVGCNTTVWFEGAGASVDVSMPIPSERSAAVLKRWRADDPPTRRRVQIKAPGLRDEDWMVDVQSAVVGADGLSSREMPLFDMTSHRFVIFVLKEQSASGTVFNVPFETGRRISDLYRDDPQYCASYADAVRLYVADPEVPANRRTYMPAGAIANVPLFCSRTDAHVFAFDLQDREEEVFDVVVETALRLPRIFRLQMNSRANYTVVDVTLMRQSD